MDDVVNDDGVDDSVTSAVKKDTIDIKMLCVP